MKLFQAILIATAVFFLNAPAGGPAQELTLDTDPVETAAAPAPVVQVVQYSPDSLQVQFERAVWNNDVVTQKQLLGLGIDVDAINKEDGYAAIHWAVERKLTQTVAFLLDNSADINLFTKNAIGNDRTPLHIAAELGHSDIVEMLLNRGADLHLKTVYEESPLHGVRLFVKNREVVELLIAHGADVNGVTAFGASPLHAAALQGSSEIVDLLIAHGAEVNLANKRGLTPLHLAAQHGHADVVIRLVDAEVDMDAQTRTGDTALHLAAKKGHSTVIRTLLNSGANPLTLNKFSKSPLTEAQERANTSIIELFSEVSSAESEG